MALNDVSAERPAKVGHVSHEALVRIDRRVATILARRKAALEEAQLAARRLGRC